MFNCRNYWSNELGAVTPSGFPITLHTGARRCFPLNSLLCEISQSRSEFESEWGEWKKFLKLQSTDLNNSASPVCSSGYDPGDYFMIKKSDLQRLCSEVRSLKQIIPKLIDKKYLTAYDRLPYLEAEVNRIPILEQRIEVLEGSIDSLKIENEELRSRLDTSVLQCQGEKQDNRSLRQEVSVLSEQLSQQSEYCTGLGTACCTLLWRVSREEQAVQNMLNGSTSEKFLLLVPSTLESYLAAYKDDWPGEDSIESKFVLSLCGVLTNIAASATGREFLMKGPCGVSIVDSFLKTIAEAPKGKAEKLKCLLIMTLFNLTINPNGLQLLSSKSGIIQLFTWLLKDESNGEIRLHSLHLIQSLICDENNTKALNEFVEMQPVPLLEKLSQDRHSLISQSATELLTDLKTFCTEP